MSAMVSVRLSYPDVDAPCTVAGLPISAETCTHYLTFAAEDVQDGATEYKCAPPLRSAQALRCTLLARVYLELGASLLSTGPRAVGEQACARLQCMLESAPVLVSADACADRTGAR